MQGQIKDYWPRKMNLCICDSSITDFWHLIHFYLLCALSRVSFPVSLFLELDTEETLEAHFRQVKKYVDEKVFCFMRRWFQISSWYLIILTFPLPIVTFHFKVFCLIILSQNYEMKIVLSHAFDFHFIIFPYNEDFYFLLEMVFHRKETSTTAEQDWLD